MSIADKLKTIAENEQRVYDTGYWNGHADGNQEGRLSGYAQGKAEITQTMNGIIDKTISGELYCTATQFGDSSFAYCTNLTKVTLPFGERFARYSFRGCTSLETFELSNPNPSETYFFNNAFNSASALKVLVLRGNIVATLQGTQVFTGTALASGNGLILVPNNLVDSYRSATNWVAVGSEIRSIEMYTKDGTTTGELFEDAISAYLATLG